MIQPSLYKEIPEFKVLEVEGAFGRKQLIFGALPL